MKNLVMVVVVDDNANNLLLEKDLLEVAGFEVYEAVDGATGLELCREKIPAVIVLDVRLPDISGLTIAKTLRQEDATRDIPIAFVTASVLATETEEIRDISNSIFIGKPIDTRTFANSILGMIKQSQTEAG